MTHKNNRLLMLVFAIAFAPHGVATAGIIESGDLNIIDDAGNPSDGFGFLDMTFSDGKTKDDALAAAQAKYLDARLATPSEADDLFAAAGITYDGSHKASDGWVGVGTYTLSSGSNYDGGVLSSKLGITHEVNDSTLIWTNPNGFTNAPRDELVLGANNAWIGPQFSLPPNPNYGWLILSESATAVPEPSSLALSSLLSAAFAVGAWRRKRKRRPSC